MATKREQILQAITTKLVEISGVNIDRNRPLPMTGDELPMLVVVDGSQKASHNNHYETDYQMTVDIEGAIENSDHTQLGNSVNQLYSDVIEKLAEDITLGGLCTDITEVDLQLQIIREESITPAAEFNIEFRVYYSVRPLP
jgi:hypothetical protein